MNRGDLGALSEAESGAPPEWMALLHTLAANQGQGAPPVIATPKTPAGWLAVRQLVLRAAIGFDLETLHTYATSSATGVEAEAVRHLAAMWLAAWERRAPAADMSVEALALHDAGVRVERASLQALQSLHTADYADALSRARRASRMAASEGLIQMEYLANVVLARARRQTGSPHLATRILVALEAVVPPIWRRWVEAEKVLAGDARTPPSSLPPALDAEAGALASMMGAGPVADVAKGWVQGLQAQAPFGIEGPSTDPLFVAFMVSVPGAAPRRTLCAGLDAAVPRVAAAPRATRTRLALCELMSACDGMAADELFERVYGFPREDPGHDELLRGLVFRVRKALGDHGDILREGERLRLVTTTPFAAPDPRCDRSMEDRMLRFLSASSGRATAKEIASSLGIPLRTVQRGLGSLVEDGACTAEADGRRTEYVLEDTTFAEPTLHRLRGQS